MNSNNPAPPGEEMSSDQNEIGHLFPRGRLHDNSFTAVTPPRFWGPPPVPQYFSFGPRPFLPFPPGHPFGCSPPVFNVPPPVHPSYCNISNVHPKTNEKLWLKTWLHSRTFEKHSKHSFRTTKISDVRENLRKWTKFLNKLDEKHSVLEQQVDTLSEEEWSDKWTDVENRKSEIILVNSFSEQMLVDVKKKVLKQVRKRCRLKRQHAERRQNAHLDQLKQQSLHQKADAWLADMQLTVDRALKDEKLKKEADAVLAEVTHHQSEGRRQIALLEALQKLHQARIQTMEARGSKLNAEDLKNASHSASVLSRLMKLWVRKVEGYAKEEARLRVMLEETAAKQSNLEIENVRKILGDWDSLLFGPESPRAADKLCDIDTLVSIRYAWDQYIVPDGVAIPMASAIPIGWVLPTTPSSFEWQQLLSK